MSDIIARIKPKKSSTSGEVPQDSDLEIAELAVNTADGRLFTKHTDNSIKEISSVASGAPASASDDGVAGQTRFDADYFYICVAANTWKRAALSTW